jgi:hypothetical protein
MSQTEAVSKWTRDLSNPEVQREMEDGHVCLWVKESVRLEAIEEVEKKRRVCV